MCGFGPLFGYEVQNDLPGMLDFLRFKKAMKDLETLAFNDLFNNVIAIDTLVFGIFCQIHMIAWSWISAG